MIHKLILPDINAKNRYVELDCLRGIAAISVVLFHFTYFYDEKFLGFIDNNKVNFKYGNYGVQLFFLVSGFVIIMTLERTNSIKDFIISRFSRLYPTYWAAIIFSLLIKWIIYVPGQKEFYSTKQIFFNFTMFQYLFKAKDIDGPYWTLFIELTFYTIMGTIFYFKQINKINSICYAWLAFSLILLFYDMPLSKYIKILIISNYAPLFIGGIGFFLIKKSQEKFKSLLTVILSFVVYMVYLFMRNSEIEEYFIIFLLYSIMFLFVFNKLSFIAIKPLLFLGNISYPLYLVHNNIGWALIFHLKKLIDIQLFYLPITILIVIFLGSILSKFVEKPAMVFIRNRYLKKVKV